MVSTTAKAESKKEATVVRNIRFTGEQWRFLESVVELTGCPIAEYIRRLVDAERNKNTSEHRYGKDGKR